MDLTKIVISFLAALLLTWTSLLTRAAAQDIEQALLPTTIEWSKGVPPIAQSLFGRLVLSRSEMRRRT